MFVQGNYVFGNLKQNLKVDQKVVLGRTSDPKLDGMVGKILGKATDGIFDSYIVMFDEGYGTYHGQHAITITEACLCPIE